MTPPQGASSPILGTPLAGNATRLMLLGSGELGKEVAIEAQRLGVEVIAVDRYANAPAMQVAHRSHVINMLDGAALRRVIESEKPQLIVPEIEAIRTEVLLDVEQAGFRVIPSARAANLTMNRDRIRDVAVGLGVRTARFSYAESAADLLARAQEIGFPVVIKPVMSSSGKGQSVARSAADIETSWQYACKGMRGDRQKRCFFTVDPRCSYLFSQRFPEFPKGKQPRFFSQYQSELNDHH